MWGRLLWDKILESKVGGIAMVKMIVTEKDFEAFMRAAVTLENISETLDDYFDKETSEISKQFKSFQRRYLKAKEE